MFPAALPPASPMTTEPRALSRQRNVLEAGLFGFAVIHGSIAILLLGTGLLFSLHSGHVATGLLGIGGMAAASAGACWLFGRLAR